MNVLLDGIFEAIGALLAAIFAPIFEMLAGLIVGLLTGLVEILIPIVALIFAPFQAIADTLAGPIFYFLGAVALVLLAGTFVEVVFAPGMLPFLVGMPWYLALAMGVIGIVLFALPQVVMEASARRTTTERVQNRSVPKWHAYAVLAVIFLTVITALLLSFEQASLPAETLVVQTVSDCPPPDTDTDQGWIKRSWGWAKSKLDDC
ncbi:hypothetical protein [Halovulum sp. GXIMD14793]